ncbi:hypothetical protein M885DRAFT_502686 [Pelagophyceae sp. CCMP2097]|nr:hypothetical protein M885DRAFT_502686 [Pelagophyceae sp. CCMP2097]
MTCSKAFSAYSYHTRALEAHGLSCARRDLQRTDAASARAARRDEWSGTIEYQGEISGILVRCTFNKKILTGGVKGMVCDICSTELMVVAKYYQKQHVEAKHKPKGVTVAENRAAAFGAAGAGGFARWISEAKAKGGENAAAREKRDEVLVTARNMAASLPLHALVFSTRFHTTALIGECGIAAPALPPHVRLPDDEVRVPATRLFAPLVAASVPTDKAAMLQLLLLRQHAEIQRLRSFFLWP